MKKAFTLLELVVVLVIIGVLSTFGVSQYTQARERALYNEARANLKLILAAERVTRMEQGSYVACSNTGNINNQLRLLLPTNKPSWNYLIKISNGGNSFCAQAVRSSGGPAKNFSINSPTNAIADPQIVENVICP